MTGTTALTSTVLDIRTLRACAFQATWTGTPTGTIAIQGSIDYSQGLTSVISSGTWVDMGISVSNPPAGSVGSVLIDVGMTGVPFIRLVYTNASGTGTLSVKASGKGV